jgi:hypothetical protein
LVTNNFSGSVYLISTRKLRAQAKSRPNAVNFSSSLELFTRLADPDGLDDAAKNINPMVSAGIVAASARAARGLQSGRK